MNLPPTMSRIVPSGSAPDRTGAADKVLASFYREHLEGEFEISPMRASKLGDHRFDALLDDPSPAALERRTAHLRSAIEELPERVDYARLSREAQIDFEILRDALELDLWLEKAERPWQNDPRLGPSLATDCAYVLLTQSTLPREANISNAIARLHLVPAMLASARGQLREPPRVRTEVAIRQNRGAIAFYERTFLEMLGATPLLAEAEVAAGLAAGALREHLAFLEHELLPRSTGEWRAGREHFVRKLERVLDADVTADELLADAERALEEAHREMLMVSRQLWHQAYPREPLPPDDGEGRHETIERVVSWVSSDHGTPESLPGEARDTVDGLKAFIREHDLLRLPEPDACQIIEMPEFQRGNSVAFLEPAPPFDTAAPSIYAISPPPHDWPADRVESFLREYNRHLLKVLTIHEAYPGHHVQLDYANRHPSLIRRILGSGVYAEGWANYCERMLPDQGYGGGDLALRLVQLKFYLRSVANAILDHRMHCTGTSDDEAIDFLTRRAFQTEGEARLKVVRAKLGSCQLSTYFAGRRAFMNLRATLQREQGADFELGRFHEAVLSPGSVPVKYLPELTRSRLRIPR